MHYPLMKRPPAQGPMATPTATPDWSTTRTSMTPTTAQPSPSPSQGVLQMALRKYAKGRWYSTYDPWTEFPNQTAARKHEQSLLAQDPNREEYASRAPTLYTYTHTKPHNKIGSVPQGPHTVAHRVTHTALVGATTLKQVQSIFDEQVDPPDDVEDFMDVEAPSKGYSSQMQPRVDRFLQEYEQHYQEVTALLKQKAPDLPALKNHVNHLMNMDPYATYGWKSTTPASKKSLKGKGEMIQNPTFADLVDKPPSKAFNEDDNVDEFMDAREDLFDEYF